MNNITQSLKSLPAGAADFLGFDGSSREISPTANHSPEAMALLETLMKVNGLKVACVSAKRETFWQGRWVGFNKAKTEFVAVIAPLRKFCINVEGGLFLSDFGCRTDFAPSYYVEPLTLTDEEKNELLSIWRHGKGEWYRENVGIPLRARAATAKRIAISNPA